MTTRVAFATGAGTASGIRANTHTKAAALRGICCKTHARRRPARACPPLVAAAAGKDGGHQFESDAADNFRPRRSSSDEPLSGPVFDDGVFSETSLVPRPLFKKAAIKVEPGIRNNLLLAFTFGVWYWSNTVFNIYNKQVLKAFPYVLTATAIQFLVAGITMSCLWLFRIKETPQLSPAVIRNALPLSLLHASGFTLTNMSLGAVSVAFTHTVKATEPFFSVALSPSILGDVPTWGKLAALFPIVFGVAIASATEASFNWFGFLSAVGSNLAFQTRNVVSKKFMGKKNTLDNINLFAVMTIVSFFVMVPLVAVVEGWKLTPAILAATGIPTTQLARFLILGGLCRCADVMASYMILNRVSPVTHSVGNCVKRAVVIVASIIFFHTKMSFLNIVGTVTALVGALIYSLIATACKQSKFGPDNPICKPVYDLKLQDGAGI